MRKPAALMLCLAALLSLPMGCAPRAKTTLYDQGMSLIAIMAEMAGSEIYHSAMTGDPAFINRLEKVNGCDFSAPEAVYTLALNENYMTLMSEWEKLPELSISDSLRDVLNTKQAGAFTTQLNALAGAEALAASAMCAAGKTFVDDTLEENTIYLYVFEGGVPAAVTFLPGEGGAVSASGLFILYEGVDFTDREALSAFFAEMGAELTELKR